MIARVLAPFSSCRRRPRAAAPSRAQLALPGAAPAPSADADAGDGAPKPKKTGGAAAKAAKRATAGKAARFPRPARELDRRAPADAQREGGPSADLRRAARRCRSTSSALPARASPTRRNNASSTSSARSRSWRPASGRPDGLDRYRSRSARLPVRLRRLDGAVAGPGADHRLRLQGRRLSDEPERPLGSRRRPARNRRRRDRQAPQRRRKRHGEGAARARGRAPRTIPTRRAWCRTRADFRGRARRCLPGLREGRARTDFAPRASPRRGRRCSRRGLRRSRRAAAEAECEIAIRPRSTRSRSRRRIDDAAAPSNAAAAQPCRGYCVSAWGPRRTARFILTSAIG